MGILQVIEYDLVDNSMGHKHEELYNDYEDAVRRMNAIASAENERYLLVNDVDVKLYMYHNELLVLSVRKEH